MQSAISTQRLSQIAKRNRNGGFTVLFATTLMILGLVVASGVALTSLSTIV